jgi:hypothetical protein
MVEMAVEAAPPSAPPRVPEFSIVPRAGLVFAGVAFALLIAAIAINNFWQLEFLHLAGGATWTILDLFLGFVLGPILGSMSIPARVEFTTRLMPKMLVIMPTVVTVTLAAGWQLGNKLGTVQSTYYHHGWVVASYIVVGVMAVVALGLLEPGMTERRLPPVTQLGMASLALIVAAGIYLSAHLPRHVPLGPAVALLAASALLLAGNLIALSRVEGFAWDRFFDVAKWALLAYSVTAGLIEYSFLQNHLRGGALVVLTLSLLVYAVHVPILIGFTVARYYEPDSATAGI